MAETTKRRFYNAGAAAGFGRKDFFTMVKAAMEGDDISSEAADLIAQACEFELEGLELKTRTTSATGEKKDPLQSDYANDLRAKIMPLLSAEGKTASDLAQEAEARGLFSMKGTKFPIPWIARVLNNEPTVQEVKKVVTKTKADGLTEQVRVVAYTK